MAHLCGTGYAFPVAKDQVETSFRKWFALLIDLYVIARVATSVDRFGLWNSVAFCSSSRDQRVKLGIVYEQGGCP